MLKEPARANTLYPFVPSGPEFRAAKVHIVDPGGVCRHVRQVPARG
jgi:hypothetical protein